MKTMFRLLPLVAALVVTQLCMAQAPAGAPAGATAICNDGTYFTGATKQGGCRGHKGIKTWFGAAAAAPAAAPAAKAAPASKPAPAAAPAQASAPAGVPAGATALCNDGTYFTGATKQGGCRGHKGIQTWFGATAAAPAAAPAANPAPAPVAAQAPAPAPASAPAAKTSTAKVSPASITPAAGGGPGLVWVNTASNVYHCSGTEWYGKTKAGAYMSEDQAKAKGAHADHGKPCK